MLLVSGIALGSAFSVEPRSGAGILAGVLAGGGLALAGVRLQRAVLERRPERSLQVFALAFLAKMLALVGGGLLLRYSALGERMDWRAFLLAYAAAVALLLPIGYHAVVTRWLARRNALAAGGGAR